MNFLLVVSHEHLGDVPFFVNKFAVFPGYIVRIHYKVIFLNRGKSVTQPLFIHFKSLLQWYSGCPVRRIIRIAPAHCHDNWQDCCFEPLRARGERRADSTLVHFFIERIYRVPGFTLVLFHRLERLLEKSFFRLAGINDYRGLSSTFSHSLRQRRAYPICSRNLMLLQAAEDKILCDFQLRIASTRAMHRGGYSIRLEYSSAHFVHLFPLLTYYITDLYALWFITIPCPQTVSIIARAADRVAPGVELRCHDAADRAFLEIVPFIDVFVDHVFES